jgi:hypothetical protein
MTFDEVDKIICSYGFYSYYYGPEVPDTSKYYMYPGIDRLAIYTENLCEQNLNSLDKKHFSEKDKNRVDLVTFSPIVLWSTGEIGINYAIESLRLWRKNIHTKSFKLTAERLNKELKNFKSSLESLLQEQKVAKMNKKLEKMETDFND